MLAGGLDKHLLPHSHVKLFCGLDLNSIEMVFYNPF